MDISAFYQFTSMQFISLLLSLLLLLNNNYQIDASKNDTHNVAKRLDIDTCSDRFDIRTSTIIRTEESKAMGAKFINDDDVSSVNACMKLCCETNECDVFVFEEKSTGSCFLFHCGNSDDFRCKFTTHSNYTSGVLTVSRKDLESPPTIQPTATIVKKPKLSQNELELVNLKRPSNSYHLNADVVTPTTTVSPPFGIRLADIITTSTASSPISSSKSSSSSSSSCGRFQFQCQTSKECIAIYNVCDQISQCEDGSDEGPECPTSVKNDKIGRIQGNNFAQMPRPMIHNREDPMTAPKFPSQNQVYSDSESDNNDVHFFNQKQNTKNFPDRIQPNQYLIPQLSSQQTMDEAMYREQPSFQQQTQKQTNSIWPEKLGRKSHVEQQKSSNQNRKKIQQEDSDYSEEYTDSESQADNDEIVSTTTEAPKKKLRKHKKVKVQKEKSGEKSLHDQLKQLKNTSQNDVDVQMLEHPEKPTGAVLSLTLGCLILAALSVLIGCRLKRVNVRRRRGKSVEEADYLVNGLYL